MKTETAAPPGVVLDDCIEAYESARARTGQADLAAFLPETSDPLYLTVLCELVRVDLEYGWQQGRPQPLSDYQRRFPVLFQHPRNLQVVAFEEFRLRRQAGQRVAPDEYQRQYGVDIREWPPLPEADSALAPACRPPIPDSEIATAARSYRRFVAEHPGKGGEVAAWVASYPGDESHARLFGEIHQSDPAAAEYLARSVINLPPLGTEFLGFRLFGELGRGAFGRVYLARQGDLANRYVALKVAAELFDESQTLAQLQHTNIVPIYSLHRSDPLQAVCMPYLGSVTLAHILHDLRRDKSIPVRGNDLFRLLPDSTSDAGAHRCMLSGLTYVQAVLWLGAHLAEGLAHAHEHGIVHRDLKPANILLTDDGQPMLLDFNLAQDTKIRSNVTAALIGGTLPYMAPEQLEAFEGASRSIDARSDLYALGIILYELLTRRLPFATPRGSQTVVLARMIAERRQPPPTLRSANPAISPAVESIVRHCLEAERSLRYQSARELAEDLQRQLDLQPLRFAPEPSRRERFGKWLKRHPRLTSSSTVAAAAAILVVALVVAGLARSHRLARLEAAHAFQGFRDERRAVQFQLVSLRNGDQESLDERLSHCRHLLDRYGVLDNPGWQDAPAVRALDDADRQRLRNEVGELLLLWARLTLWRSAENRSSIEASLALNQRAETCYNPEQIPAVLFRQRAELLRRLGQQDQANQLRAQSDAVPASDPRSLALLASEHRFAGHHAEALPLLEEAIRRRPQDFWLWLDRAFCHEGLGQDAEAVACYGTCIALWPEFAPLYLQRGSAELRLRRADAAEADLSEALRLQPDLTDAWINRGLARLHQGKSGPAIDDLSEALARGSPRTRVYFIRARARELAGDHVGAGIDRAEGLKRQPRDAESWVAHGVARLQDGELRAALDDFNQALRIDPRSRDALQNRAHVLAERLGRIEEAIETLNGLVASCPDFAPARAGRGVLLARAGRRPEALRDAESSLRLDTSPAMHYQIACIYALTTKQQPGDSVEALQLLAAALRKGYGHDLLDRDADLDSIRALPAFQRLVADARTQPRPQSGR